MHPARKRFTLREHHLLLAGSFLLAVIGNLTLFRLFITVYPLAQYAGFAVALFTVLWLLMYLLLQVTAVLVHSRALLAVIGLITALSSFYTQAYGVVIDDTMVQNMVETDWAEASDLLLPGLFYWLIPTFLIPLGLLMYMEIDRSTFKTRMVKSATGTLFSVGIIAAALLLYGQEFAGFFREHKEIRFYSNPIYPIYSATRYTMDTSATEPEELAISMPDARIEPHEDRELIVLVVGETARFDHFGLNGYSRDTTPRLSKIPGLVSYENVTSCGSSTAVSVPCMFSLRNADEFDRSHSKREENVLDVLQRLGVSVLWRDNNSGSKGVADRVPFEDFSKPDLNPVRNPECRDVGMLSGLQQYVDQQTGDILIVLHQLGNHGPDYSARYPADFEKFAPACHTPELSKCTQQEIINAYDNAIAYTDHFLAEVISFLRQNSEERHVAMIYMSDHGESLGENGVYLHGLPMMIAPETQTHVPLIVWTDDDSHISHESLLEKSHQALSHDGLAPSLLLDFEVTPRPVGDNLLMNVEYPPMLATN